MFERVGVGQADDVASERGVLGFFPDLRCGGRVVGLMADDSPLQSRSGAEPWFGAKLSFGLRLAGFARLAPVLQRIAVPKRLLVLQHGLAIHAEMTVRAMALPRQGTRTRSVRPFREVAADGDQSVTSCRTPVQMWSLMLIKRIPLVSDRAQLTRPLTVDSAASAIPPRHVDAVGAD
jgi:hypothetical protein